MMKRDSPHKFLIRFMRVADPYGEIDGANFRCFYSERSENGEVQLKLLNLNYLVISKRTTPNTIFDEGLYRKDMTCDQLPHLIVPNFSLPPDASDDYVRRVIRAEIFRDGYFKQRVLSPDNAPFITERDYNLMFNCLRTSEYKDLYQLLGIIPNVRN